MILSDATPAMKLLGPGLGALPKEIITAESVPRGKVRFVSSPFARSQISIERRNSSSSSTSSLLSQPFPDPYLMGAERLNVPISRCSSFPTIALSLLPFLSPFG